RATATAASQHGAGMGCCRWTGRRLAGGRCGVGGCGDDAAHAEAPMKAQRAFGLNLSWPRATTVFLIDVAVLAAASNWPDAWQRNDIAWWVGVSIAAVVAVIALVTYRGIPLVSALVARVRD